LDGLLLGLALALLLGLESLDSLFGLLVVPLGTLLDGVELLSLALLGLSLLLLTLAQSLLFLSSLGGGATLADLEDSLVVHASALLDGKDLGLVVGRGKGHLAVNQANALLSLSPLLTALALLNLVLAFLLLVLMLDLTLNCLGLSLGGSVKLVSDHLKS